MNSFGCKVIVDPKRDCSHYDGAWLVKPNFSEYTKFNFNTWKGNIITTNADKEVVAKIDSEEYIIPVDKVEVSDVTGAGDCFMAGFVYGLTKNYDYKKCVETATKLHLSVGTVNNWLSQGRLKRCKIGRKTFVRRAEVEQILANAMK